MSSSDYEEVHKLWLSCQGIGLNELDDSKEGIERFLLRNPDTCFVAEKDGNVGGVILAGHDGRRAYIYHLAVAKEYRGKGIGTQLVDAAMNELAFLGIQKAALVAFKENEDGNAFWEKMGFSVREDLNYRNRMILEK
ncbi:MAG: GNAT family N-acetyltransferase [Clostridiales bacterium]|nr:GNAT family N-acetyltransferase [Clostridiales bacterium]